ncbi:MAG: hypothetical protein WAL32_11520, partial [Terriglobales bacterium]
MLKYYAACFLLVGLAWGQAAGPNSTSEQKPAAAATTAPAAEIPPNTPVITIKGLCATSASTT